MERNLIFEPTENPHQKGTYTICVTVPIKQSDNRAFQGIQFDNFEGFIRIKNSEKQFFYQMPEKSANGNLFYYTSSDNNEYHEQIHEFIETNVLYEKKHNHLQIVSLRNFFTSNEMGKALAMTQAMLGR